MDIKRLYEKTANGFIEFLPNITIEDASIQDIINDMSKKYLSLSGGTMSGTLTVPIINVNSIEASDKDKFDINTVWATNGETINLVDFIAEHGAAISSIENDDIDNIFV